MSLTGLKKGFTTLYLSSNVIILNNIRLINILFLIIYSMIMSTVYPNSLSRVPGSTLTYIKKIKKKQLEQILHPSIIQAFNSCMWIPYRQLPHPVICAAILGPKGKTLKPVCPMYGSQEQAFVLFILPLG